MEWTETNLLYFYFNTLHTTTVYSIRRDTVASTTVCLTNFTVSHITYKLKFALKQAMNAHRSRGIVLLFLYPRR